MRFRYLMDKIKETSLELDIDISEYELKLSCFGIDSSGGYVYFDGYAVCCEVDWNDRCNNVLIMDLNQFEDKSDDVDIVSWDSDDGNMIEFNSVTIDIENKFVILT